PRRRSGSPSAPLRRGGGRAGCLPVPGPGRGPSHGGSRSTGAEAPVGEPTPSDLFVDDNDFFDDARAAPVGGMPASLRPVVSLHPDAAWTTRRRTDDFTFVHHTARERDRDQGSETEHRTLHGAIRGGGPGRIQGSGHPLETAPHAH